MVVVLISDLVVATKNQTITPILSLRASRVLNSVGALELTVPQGLLSNLIPNRVVTVMVEGQIYNCYLIKKVIENSKRTTIVGQDFGSFLDNRIVAYAAGSAQASKTGPADNILKQVIRENLGGDAETARSLSNNGITVEDDFSLFPSINLSFSRDLVRNVADKIVSIMANSNERMFWAFDTQELGQSTFIVRKGSLYGEIMNPQKYIGFLQDVFELVSDYSEEVNAVYAGGTGEGSNRTVVLETLNHTPLTRVEQFYDLSNISSTVQLQNAAKSKLRKASRVVRTQSNDLPAHLFGKTLSMNLLNETFSLICKRAVVQISEKYEVITEWESI